MIPVSLLTAREGSWNHLGLVVPENGVVLLKRLPVPFAGHPDYGGLRDKLNLDWVSQA